MTRLTMKITIEERNALTQLAQRERRQPHDQAALIVRSELERLGLLPIEHQPAPRPKAEQYQAELQSA